MRLATQFLFNLTSEAARFLLYRSKIIRTVIRKVTVLCLHIPARVPQPCSAQCHGTGIQVGRMGTHRMCSSVPTARSILVHRGCTWAHHRERGVVSMAVIKREENQRKIRDIRGFLPFFSPLSCLRELCTGIPWQDAGCGCMWANW